jgi:hypothetical protein
VKWTQYSIQEEKLMVTSKRKSRKPPAKKASTKSRGGAKPEFSPEVLQSLITKIHKNPDLLEGDWRDLVRDHFMVSAEDERGLATTPAHKIKKIQDFLLEVSQHIKGGGKVTGKLVKRSAEEQKKTGLAYDVDIDFAVSRSAAKKR